MVDRGATLQVLERGAGLGWASGPLAGLGAQLLLLAGLAETVGLGRAGWVVGVTCGLFLDVALARALWRDPAARLGPAGWVTLARATLAVGVAALIADSFQRDAQVATLVTLASVALALDYVDGRVARRTGTASTLGARLDGEVDAFLILALSVEVARSAGTSPPTRACPHASSSTAARSSRARRTPPTSPTSCATSSSSRSPTCSVATPRTWTRGTATPTSLSAR